MSDVRLHRDAEWEKLPHDLQRRIEAGVERIRVVREEIRAEARVDHMPPVTVAVGAWLRGHKLIHALSGAWRDANAPGGFSIGVILGAGPALCEDEATVRAVLVHEFAHCFTMAKVIIDHNDLNTPLDILRGDSMDPERERRMLGDPADWFGVIDAGLMQWGNERLQPAAETVRTLVEQGQLYWEDTPIVERASFNVPEGWKTHIRSMRSQRS